MTIEAFRKLCPEGSTVYTTQIRSTAGGKRLLKLLVAVDSKITDVSLATATLLDFSRDQKVGGIWTSAGTDAQDMVGLLGSKLYPWNDKPYYSLTHEAL